jgi:hypothetical protein
MLATFFQDLKEWHRYYKSGGSSEPATRAAVFELITQGLKLMK